MAKRKNDVARAQVANVGVFLIPNPGLWFPSGPARESTGIAALIQQLSSRSGIATGPADPQTVSESPRPLRALSAREIDVLRLLAGDLHTIHLPAAPGCAPVTFPFFSTAAQPGHSWSRSIAARDLAKDRFTRDVPEGQNGSRARKS